MMVNQDPAGNAMGEIDEAAVDPALDEVEAWFRAQPKYEQRLRDVVRTAIDEMIDTPRTGRYRIEQLNTQEKAFIGVKVEHVLRGEFDLPRASRAKAKDYEIAGHEVDCKFSIKWGGWEIPTEQHGYMCVLVHANDNTSTMCVGLIRTNVDMINPGRNKDSKSGITAKKRDVHVRWLVPRADVLPVNFLLHLPEADREAILSQRGGSARAVELYKRCEGVIITRHVMASVGQQRDDARRFRAGKGGAREELEKLGLVVLNGTWVADRRRAHELGGPVPARGESVCLNLDGGSADRAAQRAASTLIPNRGTPQPTLPGFP
jgi:hypothetical protein